MNVAFEGSFSVLGSPDAVRCHTRRTKLGSCVIVFAPFFPGATLRRPCVVFIGTDLRLCFNTWVKCIASGKRERKLGAVVGRREQGQTRHGTVERPVVV